MKTACSPDLARGLNRLKYCQIDKNDEKYLFRLLIGANLENSAKNGIKTVVYKAEMHKKSTFELIFPNFFLLFSTLYM